MAITGGGRGIGLMLAEAFAHAGAELHIISRNRETLDAACAELSQYGSCTVTAADLSTPAGVQRTIDEIRLGDRPLHVLINNAGATWLGGLGDPPGPGIDSVLDINLKAPLWVVGGLAPALHLAARPGDPARVINIGSTDGLAVSPVPNYGYAASKAGVHMMTRHLAKDLAPAITVNAIAPGLFETDMTAPLLRDPEHSRALLGAIPLGRIGAAEDIAGAALYLASRAGAFVTGTVLTVDGGEAWT